MSDFIKFSAINGTSVAIHRHSLDKITIETVENEPQKRKITLNDKLAGVNPVFNSNSYYITPEVAEAILRQI